MKTSTKTKKKVEVCVSTLEGLPADSTVGVWWKGITLTKGEDGLFEDPETKERITAAQLVEKHGCALYHHVPSVFAKALKPWSVKHQ